MLDPHRERERLREERKRIRADVLAERLRDARDAAAYAAERRGLVRIFKWKPRGRRQRVIYWALSVPVLFGVPVLGTLVIGPCIRG